VCFDRETTAVYHATGLKIAAIVQIPRLLPSLYSLYMTDKNEGFEKQYIVKQVGS
jgi:hypothetical protein